MYILDFLRIYTRKEGHIFVPHGDKFKKGTDDAVWITQAGQWKPKPIILGGDARILQVPSQLEAIQTAKLHFVYLTKGYVNMEYRDQIRRILATWQSVEKHLAEASAPAVFKVGMKKVEDVKYLKELSCKRKKSAARGQKQSA